MIMRIISIHYDVSVTVPLSRRDVIDELSPYHVSLGTMRYVKTTQHKDVLGTEVTRVGRPMVVCLKMKIDIKRSCDLYFVK